MSEDRERFEKIICEIDELVEEAISLLPQGDSLIIDRAKSYWYANIKMSLDDDHEFMSKSTCNMYDTLEDWIDLEAAKSSLPQFNTQSDWDAYVANQGIDQYEQYEEDSE